MTQQLTGTFVGGTIHDVVEKKFGDSTAAEVQVKTVTFDNKGRAVESYVDVRVTPEQVKSGWDNAYRKQKGAWVIVPIGIGQYKGQNATYLQYTLAGMPISLANPANKPQVVGQN